MSNRRSLVASESGAVQRTFIGDLWERQPGEPDKAWRVFLAYRNAGLDRSLKKAATESRVSYGRILKISAEWLWTRRIEEYERHLDRVYQREMVAARRDLARRHISIAARVQNAALRAMELKYGSDLSGVTAESFENDEILKWLIESAKMERTAVGSPSEIVETQTNLAVPENDRTESAALLPATTEERLARALGILDAVRTRADIIAAIPADRNAILPALPVAPATTVSDP